MSIKNVSILMIVLSAILGLIQIFVCKAWSCGLYTISNAFVWWIVYSLDKNNRLYHKTVSTALEYIELLEKENELLREKLTKQDDKEI